MLLISNSTQISDTTNVPSERQTSYGVVNLGQVEKKRLKIPPKFSLIRSRKGARQQSLQKAIFAGAMLDGLHA